MKLKKTLILAGISTATATAITASAIIDVTYKSKYGSDFLKASDINTIDEKTTESDVYRQITNTPETFELFDKASNYISLEPSITLTQYKNYLFNPSGLIDTSKFEEVSSETLTDIERLGLLSPTILESLTGHKEPIPETIKNRHPNQFTSLDDFEAAVLMGRSFWKETLHLFPTKGLFYKYGDFFKTRLNNADTEETQKKIYLDLIYGLLEWAEQENLVIRPNINIGLNLDKEIDFEDLNLVPVHFFNLSFTVANPRPIKTTLFGQIEIQPLSEWDVNIQLRKGALKHFGRNYNKQLIAISAWGVVPVSGGNFNVNMKLKQEEGKEMVVKKYELEDIKFMFGASKFGKESLEYQNIWSWELWNKSYLEMLTWHDVENKIKPKLMSITKEQAKVDLERYYGPYSLMWIRSAFEDINNGLSYLTAKFEVDSNGRPISLLNKVLNNQNFRNFIYNSNAVTEWQRSLIEGLVTQAKISKGTSKTETIDSTELETFIESFKYQLDDFLKNLRVDFTWEKEPEIIPGYAGNYPKISFKFKQKYYWSQTTKLLFKGTWNSLTKKTEKWTANPTAGQVAFDIPKLFLDPEIVFGGIAKLMGNTNFVGQMLPGLFKNLKDFIGWEKIEFQTTDEIIFGYEANQSPTSLIVQPTNDYFDYINAENIIVWKALDVKSTHDFKNFFSILMQIFNKLECFQWKDKGSFDIKTLSNMGKFMEGLKSNPLKTVVHIINSLFGIGYQKDTSKSTIQGCDNSSTDEDKDWELPKHKDEHPWYVFFQKLLEKEITINSRQIIVGYPSFIYTYPENLDKTIEEMTKAKIAEWSKNDASQTAATVSKPDESSTAPQLTTYAAISYAELNSGFSVEDKKKLKTLSFIYPVILADPELHKMLQKLFITFGLFYPNNPLVFARKNFHYERLTNKLNTSGGGFDTTVNFIKNQDKLFDAINASFTEKEFLYAKGVYWHKANKYLLGLRKDEVKISSFNLSVKAALNSVLAMSFNPGFAGGTALSYLKVNIPELISEALKRDFYLVNFNTMKPHGMWQWFNVENIYKMTYSPQSDFLIFLPFNFSHCDLNVDKSLLKGC